MGIFDFLSKEKYDLNTLGGIEAIEIPSYKPLKGISSPTENIEYILQRKATEHKRNGRMDLAIACLRKANEIFPCSNFLWSPSDYLRLVEYLKQNGQFDEARAEEKKINDLFKSNVTIISDLGKLFENCKSMNTDLVVSSDIYRVCSECAKNTRRIFSISGKDKRFPVLPVYFFLNPPEHGYCHITFYPFLYDISDPGWDYRGSLLTWCNRPFTDERTLEQKNHFKKWVTDNEQEFIDRKNYDFLREFIPDIAPKSFGGYRRMKILKSEKYIKLCKAASIREINLNEQPDFSIYHF
jgi:tetratricopeptide (TPR) repeat protein